MRNKKGDEKADKLRVSETRKNESSRELPRAASWEQMD